MAASRLRTSGGCSIAPTLPMIAVTARSVGDEEAQIRAAGMNALLRKPLTGAMLADTMAEVSGTD